MTTTPQDEVLTIRSINWSALELTLSDGTVWSVDDDDRAKFEDWRETQRVLIGLSDSTVYPYRVINRDTLTYVRAGEQPPQ